MESSTHTHSECIGKRKLTELSFDEMWDICVGHTMDKEVVLVLIRR